MTVSTGNALKDSALKDSVPDSSVAWQILDESRGVVDRGLRAAVGRLAEPTRTVAGYHFGWWDEHRRPTDGGAGKTVRPALLLLCADAVGSSSGPPVDAAVAVELVHNFTLLHDDIMDNDVLRRHRRTVWSVFGVPTAILAGDALLTLAIDVLTEHSPPRAVEAVRWLCAALERVLAGQAVDMAFENCGDVSLEECVAMAADKTASLLSCSCALGALLGGGAPARVALLRQFGHHLGLAFQLIDDLLGIWGESRVTGKLRCSDLRTGKKSLPVVAALTSNTDAGRQFAQLYLRTEPLTEAELADAASLIELAGGRDWAAREADRHLDTALRCLAEAEPTPSAAGRLTALARLIADRDH
jgi:geranylgeranyl diphosphate synthase, type I